MAKKKTKPETGKGSRTPYKFDDTKRAAYLDGLKNGLGRGMAADAVGVHRSLISDYKKRDASFGALESRAELDAIEKVENALFLSATEDRSTTAIQVFLYNRAPERWQDRRNVIHSGKVDMSREEAQESMARSVDVMKRAGLLEGPQPPRSGNGKAKKTTGNGKAAV